MNKCISILIVEDEKIVALDLKRRLTKLGYQVTGMAASGQQAIALVEQNLPNIILMDIHIQGNMDGIEVANLLQKTHNVPVIYLTAYSEEKTITRAKATKPYGYLLKPFSDRELHIIVQVSIERHESDIMLQAKEQHFRLALEAARLGTWEASKDSREIFMGKTCDGNLEPISDWESFYLTIDNNDKHRVLDFIKKLRTKKGSIAEIEFRVNSESGKNLWYKLYGKSFVNFYAGKHQIVGILQDTTESRLSKDQLAQAATVFKCAAEGIIILNKDRIFVCANNAFHKITKFQQRYLKNKELPFLTSRSLGEVAYNKIWQSIDEHGQWRGEITAFKSNKEILYVWLTIGIIPAEASEEHQFVVMISDITAMRETQEQLSQIAYYDNLTKLPNRMLIMDRLKLALTKATRDSSLLGVLFIDLDNFKRINDTLGHAHGDSMLCFVSQRMLSVLRASDTLGRLGGDEFLVIASSARSYDALVTIAQKLLQCFLDPIVIGNMEIIPSCSIGISIFPEHSANHDELVQMADTAMYEAKNNGRNRYALYHPALKQKAVHYLTRERELHHALIKDEFLLHYQPHFSLVTKKITGVEALIRWQHPVKGLLGPAEIIPVAESSKLIVEIGNWVLTEACRQIKQWRTDGHGELRISVNISIRQLADKSLQQFIAELLYQYSLPADSLELEVTESCLQNELIYITSLEQLENLGIAISIDDFGTGYSCLSSLKNLPIHRLKIDQSFIKNIPHDSNDCAIAAAILALAQKLNLQVTAEGIETYDQADFLANLGCDELQGYLLSKPVSPDLIPYLIKKIPDRMKAFNS
ncbi:GGDEF domain-containing response regulator [Nitrosomonas supralitoralis]|uniref:GGDEF domain-containing response regulator n=1 Tax=Nitrosomonas supralitoralis TaxID=2116706 RepID=A0A2P7NSB8_9PROT|nr:GGDEF domain-containing response regulator [Nitrosomonas supralitoralis]PSJ16362.1 GGDEF domain-containing response regulator [Nitrosomonas supralitoralis]